MPVHLYREYIEDAFPIDVDFNSIGRNSLHLIVVRYNEKKGEILNTGKWEIEGVYETRREAKEKILNTHYLSYGLQEDYLDGQVVVITLPIED